MAKIISPLLSRSASGSIGSALSYGNRLGKDIVRAWSRPSRISTYAQDVRRALYRSFVVEWHTLSVAEKAAYTAQAIISGRVSGYHQFLHDRLTAPSGPLPWTATQKTSSAFNKLAPQLQVFGTQIYYVWYEPDSGGINQIWTATQNQDGTGWLATQKTSSAFSKLALQLQVFGTQIYYVWYEPDSGGINQIWTATQNQDGTGWLATQKTSSAFFKTASQLQVFGTQIYYVWSEFDSGYKFQIWTATQNQDGTGWLATQKTSSAFSKLDSQLQVFGTQIYYVWYEPDSGGINQIWTATQNQDGTGWLATQKTSSAFSKLAPQLQVFGTQIYYVWREVDSSYKQQIWTATQNQDGTGWAATQKTSSAFSKLAPQLQVFGTQIYYVWYEPDSSNKRQLWTATQNQDGTGWLATQKTLSAFDHNDPQLQVFGTQIYYVWSEVDSSNIGQIWTAVMGV